MRRLFCVPVVVLAIGCGPTQLADKDASPPTATDAVENPSDAKREGSDDTTNAASQDEPPMELIDRVRRRPWDSEPILALAKHFESSDPPRAELIRLQLKLAATPRGEPRPADLRTKERELLKQHEDRWTAPYTKLGAGAARIAIGLVDHAEWDQATDEQIDQLRAATQVRKLFLREPKLTAAGFAALGEFTHLDQLVIEGGDFNSEYLAALEKLPPRTSIRLYVDNLDVAALNAMNERRIAKLDQMSDEERFEAGVRFLLTFDYLPPWGRPCTFANLSQAGIRDPEMRLLAAVHTLEEVDISESDITSAGVAHLAGLTKVRRLGLWDTMVDSIASLGELRELEYLGLYPEYDTKMDDAGLAVLKNFKKLDELDLAGVQIGDATVKQLEHLKELRLLNLSAPNLEDEASFAALSGLKKLESLSLEETSLTDEVLKHFSELDSLRMLGLRINPGGDGSGFQALQGLDQLQYLYLSGDGVDDRGVLHLAKLPQLRSIMAQGSAVSAEAAEQLADQTTGVTIILDDVVVKSPRDEWTFKRRRLGEAFSMAAPHDWHSDSRASAGSLWFQEDGWEKIGGWSGDKVAPADIILYVDSEAKTANEGMMAAVKNNDHLGPKILNRNVRSIPGPDETASCIYRDSQSQYLVSAAKTDHGVLILNCQTSHSRFAEFLPLFKAIAQHIRVSDDAARHADEGLVLKADELK